MKNRFESAEVFESFAMIDFYYCEIEKLQKAISAPKNGLVAAIDRATGFDQIEFQDNKTALVDMLNEVIKHKKIIEADFSGDQIFLNQINNL